MINILKEMLKGKVDAVGEIPVKKIVFNEELLKGCETNRCGRYNRNWMCPPALADQRALVDKYKKYERAFVFSKIVFLDDPFDAEGMERGRKEMEALIVEIRRGLKDCDFAILGAGSCSICRECSYPSSPCRHPEIACPSLEAVGVDVAELATETGMKYYNGPNTVTYFAAVFYNPDYKLKVISGGKATEVTVAGGANLLAALRNKGFYLAADCGGAGVCKKCKVKAEGKTALACQTRVTGEMTVELSTGEYHASPDDWETRFPVEKKSGYGVAIDFGTTTIAAYLHKLEDGATVAGASALNAQAMFGSDVVSRIKKCAEGHLPALHETAIKQINEIIDWFKADHGIANVAEVVIAANTTMLHILANVNPSPLGVAPFTPVFLERRETPGEEVGINAGTVILLPAIGPYLGGDIVAGMLACNLAAERETALLVDLGTNGEIVIKSPRGYYGASVAAGPAFEGARIECGTGGIAGAIAKANLKKGKLITETVGNKSAIGICGSGLVDLIAILIKEGLIDEAGTFCFDAKSPLAANFRNGRFYITSDIYLTQKDIREFQLAKSAVAAGIRVLTEAAGVNLKDIERIYLAGGFGFYLNPKSAVAIGLLPEESVGKITALGNASGRGARMALLNGAYRERCDAIAREVKIVELAHNPRFSQLFIEHMSF